MTINVKISLCSITRSSKIFQRNYYLPLLKPLSPKDAARRKKITGENVLGARYEHYIPCLASHEERSTEKKARPKGAPVIKRKVKMTKKDRYVAPFLDEDMPNHTVMMSLLARKGRGKGQHYIYDIVDKNCILVINYQMEMAIKDKDIVDVVIAQRSEKVVVKLSSGLRITLPLAPYDGAGPLYNGSGWTKEIIDEEHHHGKETISKTKIFEFIESGVENWELEMMKLANRRKRKNRGSDRPEWKKVMEAAVENMDWDKFEEDAKQIVEEVHEIVEEENIPMKVDDMAKTKHVEDKLTEAGLEVLEQLPVMEDVSEVIRSLEKGKFWEIAEVSGVLVTLRSGKEVFVVGQMVKGEDGEVFVPGQTLENDEGVFDYVPGVTVLENFEPTLIPGLVMGEENTDAMFLPGESAITEDGQLKFEGTEADYNPDYREGSPELPFEDEEEEEMLEEHEPEPEPEVVIPEPEPEEEEEEEEQPKKPIKRELPCKIKRIFIAPPSAKKQVFKAPKKRRYININLIRPLNEPRKRPEVYIRPPIVDPLKIMAEQLTVEQQEEKMKFKEKTAMKIVEKEVYVDKLRSNMRMKYKTMKMEKPLPFIPMEPVEKSTKLKEMEESIKEGSFLENDKTKTILENVRMMSKISRHRRAYTSTGEYAF